MTERVASVSRAASVSSAESLVGSDGRGTGTVLLRLRDVTVSYEWTERPALCGVDFELREGEAVLLLGPSGCGKSTLAMLCAGMIPTAVEARVSGEVWRHPDLLRPGAIGYVFQDPEAQLCMLRVDEEIAFGLENAAVPRDEMDDRIRTAMRRAGLAVSPADRHAGFSGGMKQKLALACALALQPRILMVDEPTANLDPAATAQVFAQLRALRDAGQTMLVIEHKFDPLLPWMDRVVLFDGEGRIVATGPCMETVEAHAQWLVEAGVLPAWRRVGTMVPSAGATSATRADAHATAPAAPMDTTPATHSDADPAVFTADRVPAARLRGATLRYGSQAVWQDVTVTIPAGSFTAIVGPNGAGKSTLLQVLAGLRRVDDGEMEVFGRPLRAWSPKALRAAVAMCFQNPEHQFIFERVADEMAGRSLGGLVPPEVEAELAAFGLDGTGRQSPFGLSQGQKRRLSVAVILRDPHELYLFDEPTFGQDARTQAALMARLAELHAAGKTIVITTHDMDLVRRFATHVIVLAAGGVRFAGSPEELWQRSDVLREAHLLDDVLPNTPVARADGGVPRAVQGAGYDAAGPVIGAPADTSDGTATPTGSGATTAADPVPSRIRSRFAPLRHVNPAWQSVATLLAIVVVMFARTLPQSLAALLLPVLLAAWGAGLGLVRTLRRLSAFIVFYVLYIWSFAAFSAVPPGARVYHVLWFHLSWPGLYNGLVLAGRMLGGVALGLVLVSSVDISRFVEALCQNFRCPPKFAYGVLAGLRFVPLFRDEWTKLREARAMRGKEASPWTRPVAYALPLLAQAIRMSERVALAMEARGLTGPAAERAAYRTYFWPAPVRAWDIAYTAGLPGLLAIGLWLAARM